MGPAPAVPETDIGLAQFCVMDLGLILCNVRSNELQNLRLSLSQVLHLIGNWANAVSQSSSYEGSRACRAQITGSAFQVFALSCVLFHRKMNPHEELPSRSEYSLPPPQKAVGPCPCLCSPLCIAESLRSSAMEAAVQQSHPVPTNVQLVVTAGIPHVAACPSLPSCKQVAGVLPQPFLPLAQVGSEHPTALSSPG